MQIERIEVKGLYGLHNYEILFDDEACIKIIHAPNGYGKTTVLKLIKDIIEGNLLEISIIPFDSFLIQFDGDLSIKVTKGQQKNTSCSKEAHMCYVVKTGSKEENYCIKSPSQTMEETIQHMPIEYVEKNLLFFKKLSKMSMSDESQEGRSYLLDKHLDEQLTEIRAQMPICFINANRLYNATEDKGIRRKTAFPVVMLYAKELADAIKTTLAASALKSEELDRSFPARLIKRMESKADQALEGEVISKALNSLETKRNTLQSMDLLSEGGTNPVEHIENLDENALKILQLYIEDSEKKLEVFDTLAPKIQLMQNLINRRFAYKTMRVSKTEGFVFEVPTGEVLTADKLSSGEQNELVLIYELLFKSKDNALILMDEPEISLHIAWQQSFLEDMEAIADLTQIKLLIATHSPDIINGRWDLTTGLEEG